MSAFRAASDPAPDTACTGGTPGAGRWRARTGGAGASLAVHGVLLALLLANRWLQNADQVPLSVAPVMELHDVLLKSAPPRDVARNKQPARQALHTVHRQQTAHDSGRVAETPPVAPVPTAQPAMVAAVAGTAPSAPTPAVAPVSDPARNISSRRENGTMPPDYAHQVWLRIMAFRPPGIVMAGTVGLRFRIDGDGRLTEAVVARTSGLALLDRAALQALRRAAPFPPPPHDLPADTLRFDVTVHFGARQQTDF